MSNVLVRWKFAAVFALTTVLTMSAGSADAQKKYDTGATDTEIRIGNIVPYSGPVSAYGVFGKVEEAYFKKVNDEGGIRGRKIRFISYDDAYSPPKAFEQARKLVESDDVLFIFSALGTPSNAAIQKYLNAKKIPQLFVVSGAAKFADPKNFPWTMGWPPSYQSEGRVYGKYILQNHPDAKIGILYQNDDYGKDLLKGVKEGLGDKTSMIISELSYETSAPTIESEVVRLKASGATVFINITTSKFAAQAIKKAAELNWHPVHIVTSIVASVGAVLKPAGLENSLGLLTAAYVKDPVDPALKNDPAFKEWSAFMDEYYPDGDKTNGATVTPYLMAQTMMRVLELAGDDLTRENIMRQAENLKGLKLGMLIDGIEINTSPEDFSPVKQLQMMRFTDDGWRRFGKVLDGNSARIE